MALPRHIKTEQHKENTENVNVQNMLNTARTGILNFQRNPSDMEVLSKATDILIECLEIEPTSFESVYLLAYSCYVLNDFSTCMKFFDLLDETETNFPAADELKHEVLQLLEGVQGTIEYPPLILENELSQEAEHILTEIFKVLDTENKGYLGIDEFNRHILFTGGSHKVDAEQFNQITRNYNENAQLGLSLQGFMNLYYEQILHDPSEFRKDLELYNMDPYLLKPKSIKAAQCA
ncbi:hypothetical protein O9G_002757 [Rozella allomycis CSF55]|uniref:EF-hand domain-containing protein n=1 Tax=Rozella allomycis (strain CSF55) TaxID=988480 RepID=A0A075B1M9_ROZAC|nr:hypothetical protein O9G_002757 [Rozella allomycis CSF55]|eukprot:EPZ34693.1 hypothetical protein O9G_002757 [Rozella allomycis CSF55]